MRFLRSGPCQRDEWQELGNRADNDQPEPNYWHVYHRPVETPDGQPLGTALVMIEFPQLMPDFGAYIEAHAKDDPIFPTNVHGLELAHFAGEDALYKFKAEFRS